MKKIITIAIILALALTASACSRAADYSPYVSQLRTEILFGETENYSVTAIPETRESPFSADGKVGELTTVLIIKVTLKNSSTNEIRVDFELDKPYSQTLTPSGIHDALVATIETKKSAPAGFTITLTDGERQENVTLYSQKHAETADYKKALGLVASAQKELFESVKSGEKEIHIRLLNEKDANFWYVGILDEEETRAFLIDAKATEIVAEKTLNTTE